MTAPAAFAVDLPAGLGEDIPEGWVRMTPLAADNTEPYVIRLQIVDESGIELAVVRLTM